VSTERAKGFYIWWRSTFLIREGTYWKRRKSSGRPVKVIVYHLETRTKNGTGSNDVCYYVRVLPIEASIARFV